MKILVSNLATLLLLSTVACGDSSSPVKTDTTAEPGESGETSTDTNGAKTEVLLPMEAFVTPEPPVGRLPENKDALRIAYSNVHVTVDGDIARTVVTEVLVNDADAEVASTFTFPLPDDAAVTGFADWRDGVRMDASIAGKDAARKEFDRAVSAGETAALAEHEPGRRFKMELSPIAGSGQRRIELSYTQTLSPLGGERRYIFPAKRYTDSAPTLLDVEVEMINGRDITSAKTWNHRDARLTRLSPQRYIMHLSRSREYLKRDVVVSWEEPVTDLDLAGRSARRTEEDSAYIETRFAFHRDPNPESRTPRQVVLVMDRSLSMAGSAMAHAQEMAAQVLEGLDDRDMVGLVSFASDVSTMDMAPASAAHRSALEAAIADMVPRGHSNLGAALDEAAVQLTDAPDALLVLMTDGQPTLGDGADKDGDMSAHGKDFAEARVVIAHFNYPSRGDAMDSLFPEAARHYVPDGDAGADVVTALAKTAVAPVIEDLTVEIVGADLDSVHGDLPKSLAMGESVRLLARADESVMVRVRGTLRGEAIELDQPIPVLASADEDGDRGLGVEWARFRIQDYERRFRAGESDLESSIRGLGAEYHLATTFTSFVATDSLSPDRIMPGDPEIRIRAPRGAGKVFGVLPWGEIVECSWDEEEALWLGRFLVPRGTPDGLYRVRLFVESQSLTTLRGTLMYRVDSAPPKFELNAQYEDGTLNLVATPLLDVFDAHGDSVRDDLVDLRRITVRVNDKLVKLKQAEDNTWTASLPLNVDAGDYELTLVAVDFAANSSETSTVLRVVK